MGLFEKKEKTPCPVCGGEVTGLFKTKIGGGQEICKECTNKISIQKDILKAQMRALCISTWFSARSKRRCMPA